MTYCVSNTWKHVIGNCRSLSDCVFVQGTWASSMTGREAFACRLRVSLLAGPSRELEQPLQDD
jgi:hypothetical protein